jgi:hypothetical protein
MNVSPVRFGVYICVILLYTVIHAVYPGETPKSAVVSSDLLRTLFTDVQFTTTRMFLGNDAPDTLALVPQLRGMRAAIPFSTIECKPIGKQCLAAAFEIYLSPAPDTESLLQQLKDGDQPSGACKLIQCIVVDRAKLQFRAKPDDFPLRSESWNCTGDVCDLISLQDLIPIDGSSDAAIVTLSEGISSTFLFAFRLGSGQKMAVSKKVYFGDLSGETGCEISKNLTTTKFQNGNIILQFSSSCSNDCRKLCAEQGIAPGAAKISQMIPLLKD